MTTHPGYPADYLDLFKCREKGVCFHCQKNPAPVSWRATRYAPSASESTG